MTQDVFDTRLEATARALVALGKGIVAANEGKRHRQDALQNRRPNPHEGKRPGEEKSCRARRTMARRTSASI